MAGQTILLLICFSLLLKGVCFCPSDEILPKFLPEVKQSGIIFPDFFKKFVLHLPQVHFVF